MTHQITRRKALTVVAAVPAAVAVPVLVRAEPDPEERIRLALKELEAAFAAYYSDATELRAVFNGAKSAELANRRLRYAFMADRLDEARVSHTAHNPMNIN